MGPGCSDAELGVDEETISTYEAVMVHELFHVFGAVASCAPNYIEGSHVGDEPTDLMYVGSERPVRGEETVIDVGRNDYYGHGRAECLDTSGSRFLEPATGFAAGSRSVEVRIPRGIGRSAAKWSIEVLLGARRARKANGEKSRGRLGAPASGRHSPPQAGGGKDPQFRDGSPLGGNPVGRDGVPLPAAPFGVRAETGAIPTIGVFAAAALRAAVPV